MSVVNFPTALEDPRYWIGIKDLPLHKRILHPLLNGNNERIFDLVQRRPAELLAIPGLGPGGLAAVKATLHNLGLELETQILGHNGEGAEAQIADAVARHTASGDLTRLLYPLRGHQPAAPPSQPSMHVAGSAILLESGFTAPQIGTLDGDTALQAELLDLFSRAGALTQKLGPLPFDRLLRRPEKIAAGLKLLNIATEPPEA